MSAALIGTVSYVFIYVTILIMINIYCQKRHNKKDDEWIKISLISATTWGMLAMYIIYVAQLNVPITP